MKIIAPFLCILLFAFIVPAFAGGSPTEDLKPALNSLVDTLGDESLKGDEKKEERRTKIMDEIKKGFDFREMSRRVLGKTWRKIDAAEQENFTNIMTKLLENVYVGKLETYTGGDIAYVNEAIKGKRAQVTTLIEDNGVKLPVHYIMRQGGDRWQVYDINIEGVSLVRNYQEQFKSILRKDKYDGLVKVLNEKNKAFAEGK
ncbi:MAG: phospholipid transport system substrate-binding protein [Desulforhopalus sp.]|jgi:phospholipid transport system substrate-binding protein